MIVPILLGVAGLGILYAVSHESVDTDSLGGAGSSDGESDGSSAEGACVGYTAMTMKQAQKALNMLLYTDKNGNPLAEDGQYGENTEFALREFQKATLIKGDKGMLCQATGDALIATLGADWAKVKASASTKGVWDVDGDRHAAVLARTARARYNAYNSYNNRSR